MDGDMDKEKVNEKKRENRDAETVICRCEDVTREMIIACISDGYKTLDEIKRVTRAGMGPCQGRTCRSMIASELSRIFHVPMEEVLMTTFRPPMKPISLGDLADAYESGVND